MNFLSHGFRFLDSPYVVAGTAVPDWLSVLDRRTRARSKHAMPFLEDDDREVREIALGIVQHHRDDEWFHSSRLFNETMLRFAIELRDQLPGDEGFRPSFVAHILVEILIDATLIAREPSLAERYYVAIESVSAEKVQRVVNRIARSHGIGSSAARKSTEKNAKNNTEQSPSHAASLGLAVVIKRFTDARFLYDYPDDDKLLFRLNQVMGRVGLPPLPVELLPWLAETRRVVDMQCDALLTPDP